MMARGGGLRDRAVGSLLVVPFGAGLLFWPLGTLFFSSVLILLAAREGARLVGSIVGGASAPWSAALLLVPLLLLPVGGPVAAGVAGVALLLALISWQLRAALRSDARDAVVHARVLFGVIATSAWLSPLLLLPLFGLLGDRTPAPWIAWILAIVWSADTGAYLVGRSFGRRKLAPTLSPRKSVEGLCGGLLVATVVGALTAGPLLDAPIAWALAWSLLIAIAAETGDLLESLFKRAAGAESSATIIPGHGGVLDRIDSLLLALPVSLIAAITLNLS
jgi:phosphatidate cytidylyltransferase